MKKSQSILRQKERRLPRHDAVEIVFVFMKFTTRDEFTSVHMIEDKTYKALVHTSVLFLCKRKEKKKLAECTQMSFLGALMSVA